MKTMTLRMSLMAALALTAVTPALGQIGRNYDVKTMNFDLWCLETQHWAVDRCDKRSAEDYQMFEDFRSQVERYEVPFLQQQQRGLAFDRDVLRNDPVGNPVNQDPFRQAQSPTQQPRIPSP